jgi:hypothetical protein
MMTETTISAQIDIAVPKSAVWKLIADCGRPQIYTSGVLDAHVTSKNSTGVGAARHCDLPKIMGMKQYIVEEVTQWHEGESLSYDVLKTSAPIKNGSVVWRITGDEISSRISVTVVFKPAGVIGWMMSRVLRRKFNENMTAIVGDMKRALETKPHLRAA